MMQFEVEMKFPVDAATIISRLRLRGIELSAAEVQIDRYFAHPTRDFARTDEALRIRTIGARSFVTYKGPKLGTGAKTRREIELPLDARDHDGSQFCELLEALGFRSVAVVEKLRRNFVVRRDGVDVQGALDSVAGLGEFLELELLSDEGRLDLAQRVIRELADELGLGTDERRSYLEMLLGR
jgi:adenylate cyclase class 2